MVQVMDNMKEFGLMRHVQTAPNAFKNIWGTFMETHRYNLARRPFENFILTSKTSRTSQCLTATFNPLGQLVPGLYAPGEDALPETTDEGDGTTVAADSSKTGVSWMYGTLLDGVPENDRTRLSSRVSRRLLSLVPHIPEIFRKCECKSYGEWFLGISRCQKNLELHLPRKMYTGKHSAFDVEKQIVI